MDEFRSHRRPVAGTELAERLNVSIRTLYRDIASLRALGADIEGEPGVGYMLQSGFLLPPIMFTVEEVDALVLGSLWVADKADRPMAEAARKTMARLTAVMPVELTDRVEARYLEVMPSRHATSEDVDVSALRRAIHKEHKVKIAYADARGNTSERIIWPFFISYLQGGRLISAWCEMRQEIRHFRTDRMQSLSEMEARYPRRRHDLIKEWRELETAEMPKGKQR